MTTSLVSGTGGPLILEVNQYSGGPAIDLDALPTVTITNLQNGVVLVGPTTTGVSHPSTGLYIYNWTAPVSGGLYNITWNGEISAANYSASEIINVYAPSAVTVGPCEDGWDVDTSCCAEWDTYSTDLQEAAKGYARLVLWAATGRRFGLCSVTTRPCGRYCSGADGGIYGYYWNGEGFFVPYLFNGEWRNCWCGFGLGCMTCQPDCQVYLDGPVNSIVNVIQNGSVVDPSTYRVDNGTWLVRTHDASDDDCWILRQDFNKGITADQTLQVSYLKGTPVPPALVRAGGELACEWAKACVGAACRLPQRVTSISRQGVTVSLADVDALLMNNLTGLPSVDNVIHAFNPYHIQSRMQVVSPDIPIGRRTTWP